MRTLDEIRPDIQAVDDAIITLLNRRMDLVLEVGEYKKANNLPIYNKEVEDKKIKKLTEYEKYPGMVEAIFHPIMDFAKTLE